jgi:hypothetical protein
MSYYFDAGAGAAGAATAELERLFTTALRTPTTVRKEPRAGSRAASDAVVPTGTMPAASKPASSLAARPDHIAAPTAVVDTPATPLPVLAGKKTLASWVKKFAI